MDQLERLRTRVPASRRPEKPPSDAIEHGVESGNVPSVGQLVRQVLDGMGSRYIVEDDDVYGRWEAGLFHVTDLGDSGPVVQVHGTWERCLPEDEYSKAAIFCNEWNAENAFPKAYAQVDEEHRIVGIFGETTVDLSAGLTPAHVDVLVNQGIGTTLGLFEAAAKAFPGASPIH